MISRSMEKVESNLSFCTFREEDIKAFIGIFKEEKKKAAEELKRIYEQFSSESSVLEEDENGYDDQWKNEIVKKLKMLEEKTKRNDSKTDIFDMRIYLSFTVSAGKRTLSGTDWMELLSKFHEPIHAIVVTFDCPDLKRKIILMIREHYGLIGTYRNRYEISGMEPEWINEVAAAFDNIMINCKNKRKHWYEISSLLEPVFSIMLAGSIFLSLRIFALALNQNFFVTFTKDIMVYLSGLLLYTFIWIFLAAGLTMKLSEYIRGLFPSVEIFLNEERIKKRKNLYYILIVIIVPYVLSLIDRLSRS